MELIARVVIGLSEDPMNQGAVLVDSKDWEAIVAQSSGNGNGNGNGNGDKHVCPYCDAEFDTYEEWRDHIEKEHAYEQEPESNLWKYGLIGGGIILSGVLVRSALKRSGK